MYIWVWIQSLFIASTWWYDKDVNSLCVGFDNQYLSKSKKLAIILSHYFCPPSILNTLIFLSLWSHDDRIKVVLLGRTNLWNINTVIDVTLAQYTPLYTHTSLHSLHLHTPLHPKYSPLQFRIWSPLSNNCSNFLCLSIYVLHNKIVKRELYWIVLFLQIFNNLTQKIFDLWTK